MGAFSNIDILLEQFAHKQNARLARDRNGKTIELHNFEERRVDWIIDGINRAVIIQPNFDTDQFDPSKWSFRAMAWKDVGAKRYRYGQTYIKAVDMDVLEKVIPELLMEADIELNKIEFEDLLPGIYD